MPLVEVTDLVRTFTVRPRRPGLLGALADLFGGERREVRALDGLSLSVEPGEIVGILGPNGAGKSTAVKCLTGVLQPTSGRVSVGGLDPWDDRARHVYQVGVVFGQRTQLWWDLSVREGLDLLAAVFGVADGPYRHRLAELDEVLELAPLLPIPVRQLSLGQRVRCELAAALLHDPRLLVLDEPTIGLDVAVRRRIRTFLRRRAGERGLAVVLTSHDLIDVEQLCDRVVVLDRGRCAFDGTLAALVERHGGGAVEDIVARLYEGES